MLKDEESEQSIEIRRLEKIHAETGKLTLSCFCVPLRCHAYEISEILHERSRKLF
jgi:hypothetical protein